MIQMNKFENYNASAIVPQRTLLLKFKKLIDFMKANPTINVFHANVNYNVGTNIYSVSSVELHNRDLSEGDCIFFNNTYYAFVNTIGTSGFTVTSATNFQGPQGPAGQNGADGAVGNISSVSIDSNNVLTIRYSNGTQNSVSLTGTYLYCHHIVISTEYGGNTKILVGDYYSTESEQFTINNFYDKSINNKFIQWTGNILASDGTTTGICNGKIYRENGNNTILGYNSEGRSFYAGINSLSDTVENVVSAIKGEKGNGITSVNIDSQNILTITYDSGNSSTVQISGGRLYNHHIIVSTEYGGSYAYICCDFKSAESESYSLANFSSKEIYNKVLQWTGNIKETGGNTLGLIQAKLTLDNSNNPIIIGLNSGGTTYYAGIQTLNDMVTDVTAGLKGDKLYIHTLTGFTDTFVSGPSGLLIINNNPTPISNIYQMQDSLIIKFCGSAYPQAWSSNGQTQFKILGVLNPSGNPMLVEGTVITFAFARWVGMDERVNLWTDTLTVGNNFSDSVSVY